MDEIGRFTRYSLPGLAILFIIFCSLCFIGYFRNVAVDIVKIIGAIAVTFFASGAVGFIFSCLYFSIRWIPGIQRITIIDHLKVLNTLIEKGVIEILTPSGEKHDSPLTKYDAWSIATVYSNSRKSTDNQIKDITPYTDRLVNITHSLGTTCTGMLVFIIFWPFISLKTYLFASNVPKLDLNIFVPLSIMWILILISMLYGFRKSVVALQTIANTAFSTSLWEKYKTGKTMIYYDKPYKKKGMGDVHKRVGKIEIGKNKDDII